MKPHAHPDAYELEVKGHGVGPQEFDFVVIGGGIAGVSIGYELSRVGSVCLLEGESTLAFHTTGRSAATFVESNGSAEVRALTVASRHFFEQPPSFVDAALATPRAVLYFDATGGTAAAAEFHRGFRDAVPSLHLLDARQTSEAFPPFAAGPVGAGVWERDALELDVAALHHGFVRGMKANGATVLKSARVVAASRTRQRWTFTTASGRNVSSATVVNAAGAWGDELGSLVGCRPLGLVARRRTVFMVGSPRPEQTKDLPMVVDLAQSYYMKPDGEQFLCSPLDETPATFGDVRPDEFEMARALDEINRTTNLSIKSVRSSWAGVRTFAPDRNPVIGPDPDVPGVFWFVGQGGTGIQTAPAAAVFGAALLCEGRLPLSMVDAYPAPDAFDPARCHADPGRSDS